MYLYSENYKTNMLKYEVVGVVLYENRSADDYQYYKDMEKEPDARYMKLKLVEKYPGDDIR